MNYTRDFFVINYAFACRIAEVKGMTVAEAMLNYTHIYAAFGLGRSFDPTVPTWQAFLAGLVTAADPVDWVFQTYAQLLPNNPPYHPDPNFGCFYYAVWEGGRIRLHFHNPMNGSSPLGRQNQEQRREELRALLANVKANVPDARTIVGGSWLYNLEAYRRLFPPEYLQTAQVEEPEPQFIAQWGQFLDHSRQVKQDLAAAFLTRIQAANSSSELLHCFPYSVLRLESPVEVFYQYYGV